MATYTLTPSGVRQLMADMSEADLAGAIVKFEIRLGMLNYRIDDNPWIPIPSDVNNYRANAHKHTPADTYSPWH